MPELSEDSEEAKTSALNGEKEDSTELSAGAEEPSLSEDSETEEEDAHS